MVVSDFRMVRLEIEHKSITNEQLLRIIAVKDISWPYPLNKQLDWIKKNLSNEDIHVIFSEDKKDIGYLCLTRIKLLINGKQTIGYGLGNICVTEKGKGYGRMIMNEINQKLDEEKIVGLLFCQLHNIEFYKKCNWVHIPDSIVSIKNGPDNISYYTFVYNFSKHIYNLEYSGRFF